MPTHPSFALALDGTTDLDALHLPLAAACLVVGIAAAWLRRVLTVWCSVAVPVGAALTAVIARSATGRGAWLPVAVLVAALAAGGLAHVRSGGRELGPVVARANWLLGATIAWFVYLSVPDTEWAIAALGWLVPLAAVSTFSARSVRADQLGAEAATTLAAVAGAIVLGGAASFDWSGWWGAKLVGAAVAGVAFVVTSGRGHPPPAPAPGRRG